MRIHQIKEILGLSHRYARARRIAPSTLSRRANQSSTWLDRCATGNVTIRSAIAFVQWLSNNWPFGLEWPAGIDRPEPEPHSPARGCFAPTTWVATERRVQAVADGNDLPDAYGSKAGMAAAFRLGPSGQIASPGALCRALGLKRSVYYAVVRRYQDQVGAGRWPRAGSDSDRMLIALSASGASHRPEAGVVMGETAVVSQELPTGPRPAWSWEKLKLR